MKVLALYFLEGCPACANNEKAWTQATKLVKKFMKVKRVESKMMPIGASVTSFPTMKIEDENGEEVKRIEGTRQSGKEILKDLGVSLRNRRRTLRSGRHVSRRKLRHSTLRNHVSLR